MNVFLFLIFMLAMIVCSVAGLGGGIIIKPILDYINIYTNIEVQFLATIAILSMSVVSIFMKTRKRQEVPDLKIILCLTISSMIGAAVSSLLLTDFASQSEAVGDKVLLAQSVMLIAVLVFVLVVVNFVKRRYHLHSIAVIFIAGLILGGVSTFIGISGGVINVALFTVFFSMDMKKVGLYSLSIVFFSQITKLVILLSELDVYKMNLTNLPEIVVASILGGVVGSILVKRVNDRFIKSTYNSILILVVIMTIFNLTT